MSEGTDDEMRPRENAGLTCPRLTGIATLLEMRDFIDSGAGGKVEWSDYLSNQPSGHYYRCPVCLIFINSDNSRCIKCGVSFEGNATRPYRSSEERVRAHYTPFDWDHMPDIRLWYDVKSDIGAHQAHGRNIEQRARCWRCGFWVRLIAFPGPERCTYCKFDDEDARDAMKRGEVFVH